MDNIFKEVLLGAPPIVVITFIVWAFVKYLEKRDRQSGENTDRLAQSFLAHLKAGEQTMMTFHQEHMDARIVGRKSVEENSTVTREASGALRELRTAVERLEMQMRKQV